MNGTDSTDIQFAPESEWNDNPVLTEFAGDGPLYRQQSVELDETKPDENSES